MSETTDRLSGRLEVLEILNDELQGRIEQLEDELIEVRYLKEGYRSRLEIAADTLADLGIITNTPYAKRKWIEGE
jgi:hypothetical protein